MAPVLLGYSPHFLTQFGGKLQGGEIWSCGIRSFPYQDVPVLPGPIDQGQMDALAAALKTWFTDGANGLSNTASLTWVKHNAIDQAGHYMNQGHTNVADIAGAQGAVGAQMPAFLSVAISWLTERSRGPGTRGKVYLPNFGWPVVSLDPAVISPSVQNALVDAGKRLLKVMLQSQEIQEGFAAASQPRYIPCIASKVDSSLTIINRVSVGKVYDVQRRRKNAIPEVPISEPWNWQIPDD